MKQILIIPERQRLEECLELTKKFHLGFEYNDFFAPDILDSKEMALEIVADYKRQELPEYTTLHGAFYDLAPVSPDAAIRAASGSRMEQSIEWARKVGAKGVVFHLNYNPALNSNSYVKEWLNQNVAYWIGMLEKNPDVNIYLENTFEYTPEILAELSERLCGYSNYGVCLDYAHAFLSKVAPEIWAERLGRFIKHIHINDNDGVSDLHLAWGDGIINRAGFYEAYAKYMSGASVLVETSSMDSKIRSVELLRKEGFLVV